MNVCGTGTVATQGSTYPYFPASSASPPRVYSLGRASSLDITTIRPAAVGTDSNNISSVLLNSGDGSSWFSSGVQLLLAGAFPAGDGTGAAASGLNQWSNNYQFPQRHSLRMGQRMGVAFEGWPNNKPFPLSTLHSAGAVLPLGLTDGNNDDAEGAKTPFWRHLRVKTTNLLSQARDKHRKRC